MGSVLGNKRVQDAATDSLSSYFGSSNVFDLESNEILGLLFSIAGFLAIML